MKLEDVIMRDTRANQPAAADTAIGALYYVTDEEVLERNNGTVWQDYSVAGSGTPGGTWTLIASKSANTGTAVVDFTEAGVATYGELLFIALGVTTSNSTTIRMRVSVDGGANFLNSSGDYKGANGTGTEQDEANMQMCTASTTAARTAWKYCTNFNGTTAIKLATPGAELSGASHLAYRVPTTSQINAVQLHVVTGTFNGGNAYLYGR